MMDIRNGRSLSNLACRKAPLADTFAMHINVSQAELRESYLNGDSLTRSYLYILLNR